MTDYLETMRVEANAKNDRLYQEQRKNLDALFVKYAVMLNEHKGKMVRILEDVMTGTSGEKSGHCGKCC